MEDSPPGGFSGKCPEKDWLCGDFSLTLSWELLRGNERVCLGAKCFLLWLHRGLLRPRPAWAPPGKGCKERRRDVRERAGGGDQQAQC